MLRDAVKTMLGRILIASAAIAALVGCEGQPDNGPPPVVKTQATIDAQIAKIKADPNMSEQAKAGAIRGIQAGFDASKRADGSMRQGKPR